MRESDFVNQVQQELIKLLNKMADIRPNTAFGRGQKRFALQHLNTANNHIGKLRASEQLAEQRANDRQPRGAKR